MTDKPEKGDLPPEDSKKPRKKKAEPSAPSPTQSKTKIITWDCQDGCGNVNTRRISIKKIVNDDVCDYCGKRYHEPYTISVVDTKEKKPATPPASGSSSSSSKPKLPRKKKTDKPDNDKKNKDKEK